VVSTELQQVVTDVPLYFSTKAVYL